MSWRRKNEIRNENTELEKVFPGKDNRKGETRSQESTDSGVWEKRDGDSASEESAV